MGGDDHEPALAADLRTTETEWISGFALMEGAGLLIHDCQYTPEEYPSKVGWGHSSWEHTWAFARQAGAETLVTFHHDPSHGDDELDRIVAELAGRGGPTVLAGTEGLELTV